MKKWYRSTRNRRIFGLLGGLSETIGVDATLLRILLVVLAVFTSGAFILAYILAAFVVPKEPPYYNGYGPDSSGGYSGGGYGGYNGGSGGPGGFFGGQGGGQSWSSWQQNDYNKTKAQQAPPQNPGGNLDAMMDDLERKALRREIDELKAKLAKLEKEKGDL